MLSQMASYFSVPNKTKYLFPSQTLRNPSILSNLMWNDFATTKVLYEMSHIKTFSYDFRPIRYQT